jgi:hypothetical protein
MTRRPQSASESRGAPRKESIGYGLSLAFKTRLFTFHEISPSLPTKTKESVLVDSVKYRAINRGLAAAICDQRRHAPED